MTINVRNFGVAIGRLAKDPAVFTNEDGSRKVYVTLALQNNFKSNNGQREAQFINFEAWIQAGAKNQGPYDYMKKGDLVGFQYSLRSNTYTDREGKTVYTQVLNVESVDLMETKASAAARAKQETADAAVAGAATLFETQDAPF